MSHIIFTEKVDILWFIFLFLGKGYVSKLFIYDIKTSARKSRTIIATDITGVRMYRKGCVELKIPFSKDYGT